VEIAVIPLPGKRAPSANAENDKSEKIGADVQRLTAGEQRGDVSGREQSDVSLRAEQRVGLTSLRYRALHSSQMKSIAAEPAALQSKWSNTRVTEQSTMLPPITMAQRKRSLARLFVHGAETTASAARLPRNGTGRSASSSRVS
jgi:hypothetical protein